MTNGLSLVPIPDTEYNDYRYEVIFKAFKWDPQVQDENTISRNVLLISGETAEQLETWAEELTAETIRIEEALLRKPEPAGCLGIPKKALAQLKSIKDYRRENHVRLMRFDFHPTEEGWAVSEVNSDVPAGMAEGSVLSELACKFFITGHASGATVPSNNIVNSIYEAFKPLIRHNNRVAFVHATSYAEDVQMVQCLGETFANQGVEVVYAAPNQIGWKYNKPLSLVEGYKGEIGGIVRYFPAEWLCNYRFNGNCSGYFTTNVPSCNHPIALYSQSKRVPLIWDRLDFDCPTWRRLLPLTVETRKENLRDSDWIYKPALGRVGEGITIKEALSDKEYNNYIKAVKRYPKQWVSQQRFKSLEMIDKKGDKYHLCVGVFTVNGKRAGFYGRASRQPRIDEKAIDIPILIYPKEKS